MAGVKNSNFTMVPQNFFSGYHLEVTKFVTEARKGRNRTYFISGDGVKSPFSLKTQENTE